ncbi:MAG: hypothetical protein HC796_11295 [Synechococcaceae cyanobacterium RL_1_2]|nr:hypothetical protein [Synechococcaceae cyanobacterium RL_1_2]
MSIYAINNQITSSNNNFPHFPQSTYYCSISEVKFPGAKLPFTSFWYQENGELVQRWIRTK